MRYSLILNLAVFLCFAQPLLAQEAELNEYLSQRLTEKLFVHTDKDAYLAGEICWFKLYAVEADAHHPLDLSKVAYLEWLDKANQPVLQTKIGLRQGHGDGSVYLPMNLPSGNYKLRAYTNWMKNNGADWFFEKTITVVNTRRPAEAHNKPAPVQYKVDLFPEGGNLVEAVPGKIAFCVRDQYGHSIACTGIVTEDDQDTVARYHTLQFGIGSFMLTPRPGHRYRSTVRLADGTAISTLLPAAYKEGIVMHVSKEGDARLRVDLQSTTSDRSLYLIAHTRQSVKLAEAIVLHDGKGSVIIDRNDLGDGISHLTVFNAARQPVCERLVFRMPSHPLHIAVSADKESYSTRDKVNLQIDLAADATADCSLSVFRVDSLQTAPSQHIGDYLWLTSDLKGAIESPDYYFEHPDDEEAMDNLMLSQGWRRFRWEDVLHKSAPSFGSPPEYNGAIISGRVVDTRTGKAAKGVPVYLSVPGTRTQFAATLSDNEGQVKFELKDFYGGQEVIVQTNLLVDSQYRIDLSNPFSEMYTDRLLSPFLPPVSQSATLADRSVAVQVLNRYAGQRLKRFDLPSGVDTTPFYYKPDYSYKLDDYTRFTTIEEVLREYVTCMEVRKKGGHFFLPLFDLPSSKVISNVPRQTQVFEDNPLVLLDGVPVFNMDSLMAVDPLKIRRLETIHGKFFLGTTSFDGIMNWTTYKGDLGGYVIDPRATVVDYEGLELEREFYSPSYATDTEKESHVPDFRNLLYWSPVVPIDIKGKGTLGFYSSDIPGKYIVIVEGLTANGATGTAVTSFEVK